MFYMTQPPMASLFLTLASLVSSPRPCTPRLRPELTSDLRIMQYAAPEQRIPDSSVDHRADIYALGLILNEMFTGEVPHGAGFKRIKEAAPNYAYLDVIVERMTTIARETVQPIEQPSWKPLPRRLLSSHNKRWMR